MLCCTEQVHLGWISFIPAWDLGLQSTLSYISHLAKQAWQRDLWSCCRHECCCNDSCQGGCNSFPSAVSCSKYAERCWKSQQQRSHCDQVARYVALALLPHTSKTNMLLQIHKDDNYSWISDRAELPSVGNDMVSSAKYFPFPQIIVSMLLTVSFSQLTFMNMLISAGHSGLSIISTENEEDARLRVPACCWPSSCFIIFSRVFNNS